MNNGKIKLIECPRDAMQGWKQFIPTETKSAYINSLLQVGFNTIDFGSFVSAKAIPQLSDTLEVLNGLNTHNTSTSLLAIVANERGASEACSQSAVGYLGFPFSVSDTFQLRNTNSTIAESLKRVAAIQELCQQSGKQLVVYISMGFGNPYGDVYNEEIVYDWVKQLVALNIQIISLADTVGLASPEQVYKMTSYLVNALPATEVGVHLHSAPGSWQQKVQAALDAGCRRFDGALKGIGGCPMANDELVGNINTEWMIELFEKQGFLSGIDQQALTNSLALASGIFV